MKRTPESYVLSAVQEFLSLKRIWFMRVNSGGMKVGKHYIHMAPNGTADILCTPVDSEGTPWILWVEAKAEKGRQTSDQLRFQCGVEAQGHHYILCRGIPDIEHWLRAHSF